MAVVTIVLTDQKDGGIGIKIESDPPILAKEAAEGNMDALTDAQYEALLFLQTTMDKADSVSDLRVE